MTRQSDEDARAARASVIDAELAWHEEEAGRRTALEFLYQPPAFDAVVQSGLQFLNIQPDELALDMGCGDGKETLALARLGARVIASDLAVSQISLARRRIETFAAGAEVRFLQANAEEMPLASASFRVIYGKAILHHLDLDLAALEVKRLLRAGGRASFAEPLAHHPLFWVARQLSPRQRTRDERPLTVAQLRRFAAAIGKAQIEGLFLFSPLAYIFRVAPRGERIFRRCHAALLRLDRFLFRKLPFLTNLAWYGVANIEKREG